MRYLDAGLCFLLMLFTIVQYNDPDAPHGSSSMGFRLYGGLPPQSRRVRPTSGSKCWAELLCDRSRCDLHAAHGPNYLVGERAGSEGLGLIITTLSSLVVVYTLWRLRHIEATQLAR